MDRLTIVSHDRFQEIIDHANDPNSIIRTGVVIGKDIPKGGKKAVIVESEFEKIISIPLSQAGEKEKAPGTPSLFEKPEEQEVAKATFQVIQQYERLRGSDQLQDAEIQKEIIKKVEEIVRLKQGKLFDSLGEETVAKVVADTTVLYQEMSIDIPKIVVVPKGEVVAGYKDFDLDTRNINLQPVAQDTHVSQGQGAGSHGKE